MFKNAYQSGLLSIFYSCGSMPLAIWDTHVQNGHIKRLTDEEVKSIVLEIVGTNVATTYMTCPKANSTLGIRLPFLVMIVKNLKRYFSFEITILDDKRMRRRFRVSNFQSSTKIKPFCTTMPIGLSGGWNQIQFNLADFTRRAYGSQFMETLRVQIHANARLRRIYFTDRLYTEEELPQDYKLYLPIKNKVKAKQDDKKAAEAEPDKVDASTKISDTKQCVDDKKSEVSDKTVKTSEKEAPKQVEEKPAKIKEELADENQAEDNQEESATAKEGVVSESGQDTVTEVTGTEGGATTDAEEPPPAEGTPATALTDDAKTEETTTIGDTTAEAAA